MAPPSAPDRVKRVGGDCEAPLRVDFLNGPERAESRSDRLMEEEAEDVSVQRADLLADDDVDTELRVVLRELVRPQRPANLVVIGDGDHIQVPACGSHD